MGDITLNVKTDLPKLSKRTAAVKLIHIDLVFFLQASPSDRLKAIHWMPSAGTSIA